MPSKDRQNGQALILSLMFLGLFSILLTGLFQVSLVVHQKIRLQLSADAAVLSALNVQANGLNTIALANRAILANDALAAQLNALVSESSFYRKLAERFSRLLRVVPYAGAAAAFLSRGVHVLEELIRRAASAALPLARLSNSSLEVSEKGIHYLFPFLCREAANRVLSKNMPDAELHTLSEIELLRQARSLHGSLEDLGHAGLEKMSIGTMDKHTKKRDWRISVAGISPVKKTGGTRLAGNSLSAYDSMKMKVFSSFRWKWKTVISSRSDALSLGYRPPEHLLTLSEKRNKPQLTLALVAQANPVPFPAGLSFGDRKLTALTAGSLVYRRPSKLEETPNTFNPFWETRLIPVASETSVRKIVPSILLREVRH